MISIKSFSRRNQKVEVLRFDDDDHQGIVDHQTLVELVGAVRELGAGAQCIDSAALLRDFFVLLGIPVSCISVKLLATNKRFKELLAQGRLPRNENARAAMGAFAASTSSDDSEGEWGGHLITVVEGYWVVEPVIDYLLGRRFGAAPFVASLGKQLVVEGRCSLRIGDAFLAYERDDANDRYLATPAWTDQEMRMARYAHVLGSLSLNKSSSTIALVKDRVGMVRSDDLAEYERFAEFMLRNR